MTKQRVKGQNPIAFAFAVLLFLLFLPLLIAFPLLYLFSGMVLQIVIWWFWCRHGRYVLFVYSDSPLWHDYIKENILPRLADRAVVLNWSHRLKWRSTLSVLAFRLFGASRAYNPMAIVFRPFRLMRRFRFYQPFRDFKHGKTEAVKKMELELFELLDRIGS